MFMLKIFYPFLGSLGLSIKMKRGQTKARHLGVFAKNVAASGSAERGGVQSGDRIIQVNKTEMDSLSYDEVIAFFKRIPRKSAFILRRHDNEHIESKLVFFVSKFFRFLQAVFMFTFLASNFS